MPSYLSQMAQLLCILKIRHDNESVHLLYFCCWQGRETLERAIKTIENTPEWGARVVYGDTDSVFVLLKGKTKVTSVGDP
jgi:hypothetical protein